MFEGPNANDAYAARISHPSRQSLATLHAARQGTRFVGDVKALKRRAGRMARSPGPLEVEATQVAGHIHYFANKKQSRKA